MLSTVLECCLQDWIAIDRVGLSLYTVEMLSRGLECFRQIWYTFVQGWNDFCRVGILSTGLKYPCTESEYLCTGLKCVLQGWNAFDRVGIPLYTVEMLSRGLECFLEGWNAL
jgi:hypothetical protein